MFKLEILNLLQMRLLGHLCFFLQTFHLFSKSTAILAQFFISPRELFCHLHGMIELGLEQLDLIILCTCGSLLLSTGTLLLLSEHFDLLR